MMLKLGETKNFTVISFNAATLCGGVFSVQAGRWHLVKSSIKKVAGAKKESSLWRELWKELDGGEELIILTGTAPGGVFFSLNTIPLPPKEQNDALVMELPRQMLRPPASPVLQFLTVSAPGEDGTEVTNVYTMEQKALQKAVSILNAGRLRADELIHPLLPVNPEDPAVFLPGIDPRFYFKNRKFHRAAETENLFAESMQKWREITEKWCTFDVEVADFTEFLPIFIIARFIISDDFRKKRKGLQIMPLELRPVRFRNQLRLTATLGAALALLLLYNCGKESWQDFSRYQSIAGQTEELKRKTNSMQSNLKRAAREQKDIAKVLNTNFGSGDVIEYLARFSKLLPQDVRLTDLRWGESGIDIVLQSERENLDLPRVLKPLTGWKVADIQQRQGRQSTTTTITAKLVPVEEKEVKKSKNSKKTKNTRGVRK